MRIPVRSLQLLLRMGNRAINWFEHSAQTLESTFTQIRDHGPYLVQRLAALLLDRLPSDIAKEILDLLPESNTKHRSLLEVNAMSEGDSSIGYLSFIERAGAAVATFYPQVKIGPDLLENVVDTFFWLVAREFPPELKQKIEQHLPAELRHRMDLTSAQMDEAKVA